jgi:quercetin dioxygenase-like cupin family protein
MASDDPIVVHPGEGEVLFDDESRSSRIKVARDELLLSETSLTFGARGAAAHIHREHADAFYVLEGSLDFHVAGEQRTLEAGALVLAPPGLVHGFQVGPNGDRHLNIHAPGAAFAKLSRARRDGVPFDAAQEGDTFAPPSDDGRPAADAVVCLPDEGERVGASTIKAAQPEISLLEFVVEPGGGVSPHFHKGHSDSFYVLEGELELHVGEEVVNGTAGTYVLAPPHVVHYFRNVGAAPARVLNLHTPGGFAEYRRELEKLRAEGVEPDDAFFERHDIFDV